MFHRVHDKLGTAGLIVACIALVFAMLGGAYAATSSSRQHKKAKGLTLAQVKKIAKQEAQKYANSNPGAPGANGINGTNGSPGAKGDTGAPGEKGESGTDGTSVTTTAIAPFEQCGEQEGVMLHSAGGETPVCNGANGTQGPAGPEGVCSTSNCHLPPNVTETGAWTISASPEDENMTLGIGTVWAPISFPIKLASKATPHYSTEANFTDFDGAGSGTVGCKGSASNPTAPSGNLCVYENGFFSAANLKFLFVIGPAAEEGETGLAGANLVFEITDANATLGFGAWAVTG